MIFAGFIVWQILSNTAVVRGNRGEQIVSLGLSRSLDDATYHVMNDVTLPAGNITTQIDHIVISPYGLFVIETKHLSGWIFGDEDHLRWTQVIYNRKHTFQNPLKQNHHHMRTVQSLFCLVSDQIHGVVVFTGSSTFKSKIPPCVVEGVQQLIQLIRLQSVRVFSDEEVQSLIEAIKSKRLAPSRETDRIHVRNVKEMMRSRDAKSSMACPRCSSPMVEKTNRISGERFLGCKRYPRCRGTRPVS